MPPPPRILDTVDATPREAPRRGLRLAPLGLAVVGFSLVWAVWSLTYLLVGGVPRGGRFNPDDREWWSLPLALVGVALVAYDAWRSRG